MTDTKQQNPDGHKGQISETPISSRSSSDNSSKDQKDIGSPNQACRFELQPTPHVIIQTDKTDDTQAKRANKIANGMLVASIIASFISGLLLVATFYIWKATKSSVDIANNALADSRRNDSISKHNDSVATNRQDSMFKINRKDVQDRFRLDSTATSEQINAMKLGLRETRREFKSLNEPYLQITRPSVQLSDSIKELRIDYTLENLRQSPAQIISKSEIVFYTTNDTIDIGKLYYTLSTKSSEGITRNGKAVYIIKDSPIPYNNSRVFPDFVLYAQAKAGFWNLFLIDSIKYKDVISGNDRIYKCVFKISKSRGSRFYPELFYNQNIEAMEEKIKPNK